ncbi:MAG: endonuclease VIII [Petrotogales bacterium]
MIEIPEANVLAIQLNETVLNKKISRAMVPDSPGKFSFYNGDPESYNGLLSGEVITGAKAAGGLVELNAGSKTLLFGDGIVLSYHPEDSNIPKKYQLVVSFDDGSALSTIVKLYGGMWCFADNDFDNMYYEVAKEKPCPLSEDFDELYFSNLISSDDAQKLSLKAFLATKQRIPGLGNGVLQDILWKAKLHPRRKIKSLVEEEKDRLFSSVKETLKVMTEKDGRDTERDLFGNVGGYKTVMSNSNYGTPCPVCGGNIVKENYLGGKIYYCDNCQRY